MSRYCYACKMDLENFDQECPVCYSAPGEKPVDKPEEPEIQKPEPVVKKTLLGRPKKKK